VSANADDRRLSKEATHDVAALPGMKAALDAWIGTGVESAVRAHHHRRLRRNGKAECLDPPREPESLWVAGEPPVRAGNELEVLIDGAQALPRIAAMLEAARSSIDIAGWHLTADFGLTRDPNAKRLRDLLAELAELVSVRVLLWAGSPLPLFKPTRASMASVRKELIRGTRIRCELDAHERPMHCHHEKLVIVDGAVAFVGGIDLTTLGGDRFDSCEHPLRSPLGWHDVATQLRGPIVADVAAHFDARWSEVTGEQHSPPPVPSPCGTTQLQAVRTVPEKVYRFLPRGDFRIVESYIRALRSARRLIYLESQFLWSPEIVEILAEKLRHPPCDDFRLVVLLPVRPNNGGDCTRGQLGVLAQADGDGGRFVAATLAARSGGLSGPLYVHAKVGVVDDVWLSIGSANLNDHSLFNDTEFNVISCDAQLARDTRLRLWSEHLELPRSALEGDAASVIDELWRPIAQEQLARRRAGAAPTHGLLELPGVSRRSEALLGPLNGLLVDG
jgi:phosphatidylserine/phosphatidylglycerophosphate/cardiolipin synthase-like enzyme